MEAIGKDWNYGRDYCENDGKNWTREEVLAMMDDKKRIESEMADWTDVLQSQGGIGMHEPLVDNEGKKSRQDKAGMLR